MNSYNQFKQNIINIFSYIVDSFIDIDSENIVITYLGKTDTTNPKQVLEEGIVKWLLASQLITGSFADYNKKMFDFFGIKYD